MQLILETDEAWSLMSVITSFVIDRAGLSQDAKQAVRRWRNDRAVGSAPMAALGSAMNEALGEHFDAATDRTIRRKGRYVRAKELR